MLRTKNSPAPDDNALDLTNEKVTNFIDSTRRDYIAQRDRSLNQENATERFACGQLMLVTTVLLSATVLVVANNSILKDITPAQKLLIVAGVLSLILSIVAGVKYYFELMHFYLKWAKALNDVVTMHSNVDFKNFEEAGTKTDSLLGEVETETSKFWLKWQIGLLGGGVGVYLLLLIAILFNFQSMTSHLWTWLR